MSHSRGQASYLRAGSSTGSPSLVGLAASLLLSNCSSYTSCSDEVVPIAMYLGARSAGILHRNRDKSL